MKWLDRGLFIVVTAVILTVISLCSYSFLMQARAYETGARAAIQQQDIDHAAVLAYARGLSSAVIKSAAVFLGFLLVFTGALYVLRKQTSKFGLKVEGNDQRIPITGELAANSPGLVMITLGVILLIAALFSQSTLDYAATPNHALTKGKELPVKSRPSNEYERPPQ